MKAGRLKLEAHRTGREHRGVGSRSSPTGVLELLGVAPATTQILRYFVVHPEVAVHGRHLQRVLGVGSASLQRDLERLVVLGALERVPDGRLVRYRPVPTSKIWRAVQLMVSDSPDAAMLVQAALCDVLGIIAAFVFGSTANGTARLASDIDVFVIESSTLDRRALNQQLFNVSLVLGREVNAVRYTLQALGERLGDPTHTAHRFTRELLAGPKHWVVGSAEDLRPLAAAAGIALGDSAPRGRMTSQ